MRSRNIKRLRGTLGLASQGSTQLPLRDYSAAGMLPATLAATEAVTTEEKLDCVATVGTLVGFDPETMNGPSAAAAVVVVSPLMLTTRPVRPSLIS